MPDDPVSNLSNLREDIAVLKAETKSNAQRATEDRTEIRQDLKSASVTLARMDGSLTEIVSLVRQHSHELTEHNKRLGSLEAINQRQRGALVVISGLFGGLMAAGGWMIHALFGK